MEPAFLPSVSVLRVAPLPCPVTPPTPPSLPPVSPFPCRRRPRASALLSTPFPHDLFAFPPLAFTASTAASDFRPELLGSVMWSAGLYFGFSERRRWGSAVLSAFTAALSTSLPAAPAEALATATHTLPFLAAGFGVDAVLRHGNGGSAVWAVAAGLSVAMYGGIYELGRASLGRKTVVSEEDVQMYRVFHEFAGRKLAGRGMCHLVDIREAIKRDGRARRVGRISDETMRRFVRKAFPKAKRSPNGFFRGVSIREVPLNPDQGSGDGWE